MEYATTNPKEPLRKFCLITTDLLIVRFFLIPHIKELAKYYDLTLVVNISDHEYWERLALPTKVKHIPIKRKVSLIHDLKALITLTTYLHQQRPDIVQTVAPKAGLIGILAAWINRVPSRIHIFQGEVWITRTGLWRSILKNLDRLVARLTTHNLVVSTSERNFLIREKIITKDKSWALGKGSISGVDINKFRPSLKLRDDVRRRLGISNQKKVFLYVGRINKDKGVSQLLKAFAKLNQLDPGTILLIVGPDEEGLIDSEMSKMPSMLKDQIRIIAYSEETESYMTASDVLVLPSYREGFGVVIIEAAATKIPAIGSNIYGISDAIQDGHTGLLFKHEIKDDLLKKMVELAKNENLRKKLGENAYRECHLHFTEEQVIKNFLSFYRENFI